MFGRTDSERLTIADKTLANSYNSWFNSLGGLNTFSETYIDFGHAESDISDYERILDLKTALSTVEYTYGGVRYTREYFTSYPDRALVIRLRASEDGKLSFTLRPTIPYEQDKAYNETFTKNNPDNNASKEGTVTATVTDGVGEIELSGTMGLYGIDFVGLYRVYTDGTGTVSAGTVSTSHKNSDGSTVEDVDGVIRVEGARDAYIVLTLGSDYELSSDVFTTDAAHKPTQTTTLADAREKVSGYLSAITARTAGKSYAAGYEALKAAHLADYRALFGRVSLNLSCSEDDMVKTTDRLLADYRAGEGSTYLEALYFQYGRYLLIASSRKGALPAHLQGAWNRYNYSPWSSGYWHNVNVQMNYWPAFSTNLAETFESYMDYNAAYMEQAKKYADAVIGQYNPDKLGEDGGNGWVINTGAYPYGVGSDRSAGNIGFTTQLFWEYYAYTQDKTALANVVYPVLADAARYITKCVTKDANGNYLVDHCDSPEQYKDGEWYYTSGTTYAQTFAYLNNYHTLLAAKEAGIDTSDSAVLSEEENTILKTVMEQLDHYDPIIVGLSGQVKEFREEEYYGDIGEYTHRHISQLVGLYPGDVINSTTPAWLDAAKYTLTERGDEATGWGVAHRLNLWARTKDGNRTYLLLQQILKNNTATNLWDLHPPFQIDGNFGGTAGVSEMLLQSHEGYIEPLAAIPDAWSSGSYTGLVARGNFTVAATWENGVLNALDITSAVGGTCRVKADGITTVKVTTASGRAVSAKVSGGILSFETVAGETYLLSGFTKVSRANPVTALEATYTATGPVTLTWGKVNGAVSYNIYRATESDASYTFVDSTTANAYTARREISDLTRRMTYVVTAVNAEGEESERALAYIVPTGTEAKVNAVTACVTDSGELQVTVDATDATAKYLLYSRTSDTAEWMLVTESGYPVLFGGQYDGTKTYGVAVVNYFDGSKSDMTVIVDFGSESSASYSPANILQGKTFVPTPAALNTIHTADYGYERLTDGSMDMRTGRFSTKTSVSSLFDATVTLDGAYLLSELRMYDFSPATSSAAYAGADMKIEISRLGVWTTVWEGTNADMIALRTKDADGTMCLAFDLGAKEADAVRISSSAPVSGSSISFYEFRLSGIYLEDAVSLIALDNVFKGKTFTQGSQGTNLKSGNYGKLTDGVYAFMENGNEVTGDYSNRLEVASAAPAVLDAVMDFGQKTVLNQLRLYDCSTWSKNADEAGTDITVKVCNGGVWSEAKHFTLTSGDGGTIQTTYRKNASRDPVKNQWLQFELGGIEAEQMEILITYQNHRIIYYEFECSGATYTTPEVAGENRELFAGKTFTKGAEATAIPTGSADYASLTDGVFALMNEEGKETGGIFNRQVRTENYGTIDAVMDFGAPMIVDELRLYDVYSWSGGADNAGTEIVVRVYNNGTWSEAKRLTFTTENGTNLINGTPLKSWRGTSGNRVDPTKNQWLEIKLDGVRAEQIEIVCKGTKVVAFYEFEGYGRPATQETAGSNVLAGLKEKDLTASVPAHASGKFPFTNAFDGDLSTRFAVSDNLANEFTLEMDLGIARELYTLKIYDFKGGTVGGVAASRSNDTDIDVYVDGMWIRVVKGASLSPTDAFTSFRLHGVRASKIRIRFRNTATFDGGGSPSASIYEITCTTGISSVDKTELMRAFTSVPALEDGAEGEVRAVYEKQMQTFLSMLTDKEADADTVAAYAARMERYAKTAHTHAYGAWETVTEATCHEKGIERRVCKNHADEIETREVTYATDDRAMASDRLPDGWFEGKKIVTIGDSITYGYQRIDGQDAKVKSYGEWLVDLLGAEVTNLGVSGTVITGATYRTRNNTLTAENVAGADVVTILLGANDWDCSFIERSSRDFDLGSYDSTDESTFCGAVRAWCEKIVTMKKNPAFSDTTFVFMTPLPSSWEKGSAVDWNQDKRNLYGYTLRDYCEAILAICAEYDIPVIDLNLQSGFYYNGEEDENVKELIPDGIHPSAEGQKFLANAVAEGLMNNCRYIPADGTGRHTEKVTVVRPTTSSTGYTEILCTKCHSLHYTDETPMLDDTLGSAKSVNLSLRGDIGLNLYYTISAEMLAAHPSAAVEFIFADGETVRVSVKDATVTEDGLYRFTLPLTAMQMSEEIEYHLVFGKTGGSYGTMSVRKYCDSIFADETAEEKNPGITELLRAMLNYGSYAQLQFGYHTEHLAAAGLFTDETDPVKNARISLTESPSVTGSLPGVSLLGYTLALESETALRVALRVDDIGAYTFRVSAPDGTLTDVTPEERDGYVVLTLTKVCATGLSADYTLTVTNGAGKTMTVSMNALCYVSSVLSGTSEAQTLTDVVRALKLYGDAAKAYVR